MQHKDYSLKEGQKIQINLGVSSGVCVCIQIVDLLYERTNDRG